MRHLAIVLMVLLPGDWGVPLASGEVPMLLNPRAGGVPGKDNRARGSVLPEDLPQQKGEAEERPRREAVPQPERNAPLPPVWQLLKALRDRDRRARAWAADELSKAGFAGDLTALGGLVEALHDPDATVRVKVVMAIQRRGQKAKAALPALVDTLRDRVPAVRAQAANALIAVADGARMPVPALVKAAKDSDRQVRREAVGALGQIAPSDKMAIVCLVGALKDQDAEVRDMAAVQLVCTAARARQEDIPVRALVEALNDSEVGVRCAASTALGAARLAAKDALPALIAALSDPDVRVRERAGQAIEEIQGKGAKVIR